MDFATMEEMMENIDRKLRAIRFRLHKMVENLPNNITQIEIERKSLEFSVKRIHHYIYNQKLTMVTNTMNKRAMISEWTEYIVFNKPIQIASAIGIGTNLSSKYLLAMTFSDRQLLESPVLRKGIHVIGSSDIGRKYRNVWAVVHPDNTISDCAVLYEEDVYIKLERGPDEPNLYLGAIPLTCRLGITRLHIYLNHFPTRFTFIHPDPAKHVKLVGKPVHANAPLLVHHASSGYVLNLEETCTVKTISGNKDKFVYLTDKSISLPQVAKPQLWYFLTQMRNEEGPEDPEEQLEETIEVVPRHQEYEVAKPEEETASTSKAMLSPLKLALPPKK